MARSEPSLVGDGECLFPCTVEVDIQPFRWDTNGFYRRLGIGTDASRVEIGRAVIEAPRPTADDDRRIITAASALLKKKRKAQYDRLVLGRFYGEDPDLIESVLSEENEADETPAGWSHWADTDISEDAVRQYDFSLARALLARAIQPWAKEQPFDVLISLGLTRGWDRWTQIGNIPVFFIGVASVVDESYATQVAASLAEIAKPVAA